MMITAAQVELTPRAITARIAEVLTCCCREIFANDLRAIILTGSASRDEITYRVADDRVQMQSDVEALVVLGDSVNVPCRLSASEACRRTEALLDSQAIAAHISVSCVHASYLHGLPADIFAYELRTCGVVIYGDPLVLREIPAFTASEIRRADAWRLLSNRLVESLSSTTQGSKPHEAYATTKLCLDLATSLLVFLGSFKAGYAARLSAFEKLAEEKSAHHLPFNVHDLLPVLKECTDIKLSSKPAAVLDLQSATQIRSWAWDAWAWELVQLTGAKDESSEEMVRALGHDLSWTLRLRGWAFAARRIGWLKSMKHWPKWSALFAKGFTPRHAIYLAANRCACDGDAERKQVLRLLPTMNRTYASSGPELAEQIRWNYREFVVDTRA